LPSGKVFGGVDVMAGDSMFDKNIPPQDQINKDGGIGQLGWAKLYGALGFDTFMNQINVPPAGVLSGGPTKKGYTTKSGDEVIISSSSGAWIMGYKVTFMKAGTELDINVLPGEVVAGKPENVNQNVHTESVLEQFTNSNEKIAVIVIGSIAVVAIGVAAAGVLTKKRLQKKKSEATKMAIRSFLDARLIIEDFPEENNPSFDNY